MVRISSGSDFSWGTEFGYLGQLAQREPLEQVYFERNMGLNSPPGTNLGHKVYIYRFFFECSRDIIDSFELFQLPDNSAGAKQQATREFQSKFTTFYANYKSLERNLEFRKLVLMHLKENSLTQPS